MRPVLKYGSVNVEYIVFICILVLMIIISKLIFKPNIKKLKTLEDNEELEEITNKFPDNITIGEEMLDIIEKINPERKFVRPKIEEAENTKTSLYIAVTNKIIIADMKKNCARIQTIAHECIHSYQDKRVIFFNFIISNINILFFLLLMVLTFFRVIEISIPLLLSFTFMVFMQFMVRAYLEVDAMSRARNLAEEYINTKIAEDANLDVSREDVIMLLKEYDIINREGIPFIKDHYFNTSIFTILVYIMVGIIRAV